MRRFILLGLIAAAAFTACTLPARAEDFRFPKTGKHFFRVTLLKGWHANTDKSGGLLLVPPGAQHAMIYLGMLTDEKLRGKPLRAIATAVGKPAGVEMGGKDEPVRIADTDTAVIHRGMAYYGDIPAKSRRLTRRARIAVFQVAPDTWAHIWTVTQPGMNSVEYKGLDDVLNGIALEQEK